MSNLSNADYDRQNVPIAERVFGRGVTIDVKRQGKGQYSATLRTGIGGSSRRFVQPMSKGAWYAGVGGHQAIQVQASGQHLGGAPVHYRVGGSTAGRDSWPVTFPTKRYGAQGAQGRVPLNPYSTTRNVTPSKTQVRAIAATGRKISATTLARGY